MSFIKKLSILLWCLFLLNIAYLFYAAVFFYAHGYLPSPFFYDKSDSFMDLFNPLHWAYDDGRYTDWGSVYPPLNFLFLKVLNLLFNAGRHDSLELTRNNASLLIVGFLLIYLAMPAMLVMSKSWQDLTKGQKIAIYFLAILGPPMLFALERGNLIILILPLLGFVLSGSASKRGVCLAILINLKAYLALLLIFYVIKRSWRDLLICICFSGVIFVVSGWLLDPNYYLFFANILNFSSGGGMFSLREVMSMPSSISAYTYVLKNPSAVALLSAHVSAATFANLVAALEVVKWFCLAASLVIISIKSSAIRDVEILALLVVFVSNLGIWVGGYTMILYVALIPVFLRMHFRWVLLGLVALIYLPLDLMPLMKESIGTQYSYLSDAYVSVNWTLGFGSFVRPVLNMALLLTMSWEFLSRMPNVKEVPSLRIV